MRNIIFKGYSEAATPEFIADYEAIDIGLFYKGVMDLFPQAPSKIIDIGAGTGRDAAWFADLGHEVTAVEPVQKLSDAGKQLHKQPNIAWIDDSLPDLEKITNENQFELAILSGVWQHLNETEREIAMRKLSKIISPNGLVIMALRHGIASPNRPVFAIDVDATIELALQNQFEPIRQYEAASIRLQNIANGVTWTWLILKRKAQA
ncbi:MAG: class I SAM-dependent methyltransferase [Pseudomonadota bacterium]